MKTLDETLSNLDTIEQNIEKLFNFNWDVVDPDSPCEAYYSLRAVNVLLTQIIMYVEQCDDKNLSDYFRRLQSNVMMTQEGEKSKEFIFSFTFSELVTKAREMIQIASELQKTSHGGARKGSGRKKKEPSIQVRLPESIAGFCYGIRDEYDSMDDEGKKKVIDALESVLKASQTHFKDDIPF